MHALSFRCRCRTPFGTKPKAHAIQTSCASWNHPSLLLRVPTRNHDRKHRATDSLQPSRERPLHFRRRFPSPASDAFAFVPGPHSLRQKVRGAESISTSARPAKTRPPFRAFLRCAGFAVNRGPSRQRASGTGAVISREQYAVLLRPTSITGSVERWPARVMGRAIVSRPWRRQGRARSSPPPVTTPRASWLLPLDFVALLCRPVERFLLIYPLVAIHRRVDSW